MPTRDVSASIIRELFNILVYEAYRYLIEQDPDNG